jgi:Spy/CpxP family protein refolding chaperone
MKRIAWIWTAVAVFLCTAALAFLAVGPERRGRRFYPPRGRDAGLEQSVMRLGLDDTKSERVRAIFAGARAHQDELRGQLDAAFGDMGHLLEQDRPDESAVLQQAERIGALRTEADKARLRTLLAVRDELTPEERAELRRSMRRGAGPGRRGRRGPPDGPPQP